jgi:hypothetical protein
VRETNILESIATAGTVREEPLARPANYKNSGKPKLRTSSINTSADKPHAKPHFERFWKR